MRGRTILAVISEEPGCDKRILCRTCKKERDRDLAAASSISLPCTNIPQNLDKGQTNFEVNEKVG